MQFNKTNTNIFCFFTLSAIITKLVFKFHKMNKSDSYKEYVERLNQKQKDLYKQIKQMRKNLYLQGLGLGLVLCLLLCFFKPNWCNKKYICKCLGLLLITADFYYRLMPKDKWMVVDLDDRKDRENWVEVYKMFNDFATYSDLIALVLFLVEL